jgi:uncharacterized repeat protein (TIGR01451 family)
MRFRALGIVVLFAVVAAPLSADSFVYQTNVGNWSNTSVWLQNGVAATRYPGQLAGTVDVVSVPSSVYTLTVDVALAEGVNLSTGCPSSTSTCVVTVPAGGLLKLTGASGAVGDGSEIRLNGGAIQNDGTLNIGALSDLDLNSGTLSGSGATAINGDFNVAGGSISGHTVNLFGDGLQTNAWSINNGGMLDIDATGVYTLQAGAIGTNTPATAQIINDGTFIKSGAGNVNLAVPLSNNNLVDVQATGALVLGASPTHTNGTFNLVLGSILEPHGTFAGNCNVTGNGSVSIIGSPVVASGGTLNLVNVSMLGGALLGPVSGAATANISGTVTFTGGAFQRNLTVNLLSGSTTSFPGSANGFIHDADVVVATGALLNLNPGAGTFAINSGGTLTNNGTVNILGDLNINSDNLSLPFIINNNTLQKTSGAATANINLRINNTSALSSTSGVLKLNNGGVHSGNFFTGTSAGIAFGGGTHQFAGLASMGGTGTFALSTGTMDVDTNITLPGTATFQLMGGTLTGSAALTIPGTFLWSGGTMDNSSGGGQTVVSGNASQIATTSAAALTGRTLVHSGTMTYNPGASFPLSINSGALFINTGNFNLVGDTTIASNGAGSPTFNNGTGGVINKSTGAGTATFACRYDGSGGGTLNITSGTITLSGGGTNLGSVSFGTSANQLILDNSTFTHTTTPTFVGNGMLVVTGLSAFLGINPSLSVNNLAFSGGTISGGTLNVANSLVWQRGTMTGGITNIPGSCTVSATSLTGTISIDGHTFNNAGTFNWNGTTHPLEILNGGTLNNSNTFNATGSGFIDAATGGTIVNSGTFRKTGGTSGTRIDPPITNSGSLSSEVSGQSLIINGGGSQSGGGSMNTVAGAFLDFFGGTYSVSPGTSPFLGSGTFRVNGGTLAITGSITNFPVGAIMAVSSGALDVAASNTFQVPQLQWTGGVLQNGGTTRVVSSGFIGNSSPTTLTGNHTLTIPAATFNYNADTVNFLSINGTANVNVETGGDFFITGNSTIGGSSTDGVTVSGALLKTGTGVGQINVPLTMTSGTSPAFGASGGTLKLNGGGSANVPSTLGTALSATVEFSGGTFTLGTGVAVSGSGSIVLSGATLNVNTPAITFPNLVFNSGTLGGTGTLTVAGGGWFGGTMTGTGTTTLAAASSFAISTGSAKTLARDMTVLGSATVNVSDGFAFSGAATLTNNTNGIWNDMASTTTAMTCAACTGRFDNNGFFFKQGANFTQHTVPFDNDGTVTNSAGTIGVAFMGGGNHTGDFASGSANIWFGGTHTFSSTSDLTGSGFISFLNSATHNGTINLTDSGLTVINIGTGANVVFNTTSPATTPKMLIAGDVGGTGAISLTGSGSSWTAGTIGGTAAFTIGSGASFTVSGAGSKTLNGRTITNNGTLAVSASIANGPSSGAIVNTSGFRTQPASNIVMGPAFTNQGTVQFGSNSIAFNGGYTQTAGSTELTGGTFSSPFTVNIDGGTLSGNGTITADVSNDGAINPGSSPGTITIAGNFVQSGTGVINAEVGGTTPGSGYDQLIVTGNATLAGTINISLFGGFNPSDADTFDLLTWGGTRSGTFANVNLPAYPAGTLSPSYEPNAFRITADTVGDLQISKTGPPTAVFGQNVTFTIQVKNNGPSPSSSVTVADPTPANLTFVGNSGDCTTAFPCALGTVNNGATKTISATYTVSGGAGSNITNTATVSSPSTDNVNTNDTASATLFVELSDLAILKSGPANAQPGANITFTITVANGGASAAQNVVVADPTPAGLNFLSTSGACTTPFPCNLGTIAGGATKVITATYSINGSAAGSSITNTATVSTTTTDDTTNNTASATVNVACLNDKPDNLSPNGNAAGAGTLSWRGSGASYIVYLGPAGSGCSMQFGTTSSRSMPYSGLEPGNYEWRVESLDPNCPTFTSSCATFTVPRDCNVPPAPVARVVGQTTSAKTYSVEWDPVPGAVRYEVDEANNPEFLGMTRTPVTGTSLAFKHDVTLPTAFYYRVHAFVDCVQTPGPDSTTVRVVIIPLPPKETPRKSVNVPAGSEEIIVQEVFIPGEANQNLAFTATTDRPWLTVRPAAGILPPTGVTLEVVADPKTLPNGTFTASVIVTVTSATGSKVSTNANTVTTVPVSVNLVTPVTPISAKPAPSQYALIIPTAGHLDGIDSHWQSDVRVTNAGFRSARYRLTFTPAGGTAQGVKQTSITVDAGATTALDDIISNWFGLGTLGDGANGMLEILPLDDPANTALTTVASSRTYNVSGNGTLGQYIPAVPFPSFIGRALPGAQQQILSLQQIAQSSAYRTNVGLAEAGGAAVNAVISIFNGSGAKLAEVPVSLAAGEQRQLNQLLASQGIELADGRMEVRVTGGDGKITAYASVVDSQSQDPLLVSGQLLSGAGTNKYVLPGVANLDNALASWRTDMRVFNYGPSSQPATLTFFPFNNGASKSVNVLLGAGQIMTLDNVLKTQFETENAGGVVHLSTPGNASLVVTGRTYNQTAEGTFGQFVPAVTPEQAVAANGRTLHILQVEDSTRYRTNVGLAEVTGKPAVVELQIVLPDSKITPTVQIPLQANEFVQFNPIRALEVGNVYNARITVRVISGEGRVTAYGSVIDEVTQDPTYVPAQ